MDIRAVAGIAKLSLLGDTFPHQKSMAGREPLLLLNLHRAVKFHNATGQHLDRYLNQDIVNSVVDGSEVSASTTGHSPRC